MGVDLAKVDLVCASLLDYSCRPDSLRRVRVRPARLLLDSLVPRPENLWFSHRKCASETRVGYRVRQGFHFWFVSETVWGYDTL